MDRLPHLTRDQLDERQLAIWDSIDNGKRGPGLVDGDGSLRGPFNAMVTAPSVGGQTAALGEALRFGSGLDRRLTELATCTVGAHWKAEFEWFAHRPLAARAGVEDDVLEAIRVGSPPPFHDDAARTIHAFTTALLRQGRVDDSTYAAARELVGDDGLVELVTLIGHYCTISFTLNAFRVGLPPGAEPTWPDADD